jgi:glycosyltransferase involved in cell wall biosynthesis
VGADVDCPAFHLPDQRMIPRTEMLARLRRILDEFRPDLVQLHTTQIMDAYPLLARSVPTTVFIHDQSWFCADGDRKLRGFTPCHRRHTPACLAYNYLLGCGGRSPITNWKLWRLVQEREILHELPAIRIQVASGFMRQGLLENRFPEDRIDVVPLYSEPPPSEEVTENGLILCPSRLVLSKGVHLLLDALARIRETPWKLIVAGAGPRRADLERQAGELAIADRVTFTGEVSPAQMAGYYGRAQLVAFPVLRQEPFGLVGVEALAYGKPIVAFAGGAVDEWLWPDVTGIKVQERTATAFGQALEQLLKDPERCRQMSKAAERHYPQFKPLAYIERLMASFQRTIDGAKPIP